jgi:hypothetical protein
MGLSAITTTMMAGVIYTATTDNSTDWSAATNNSYFYDKTNKIVYYKNSSGTVIGAYDTFTGGTISSLTVNGNLTVTGTTITPNTIAFRVYGSGTTNNLTTTQNGDGTLNSNNFAVDFQQGSDLNTTTGVFTASVAGLYQVNLIARNSGYAGGISQIVVYKNSTVVVMIEWAASSTMNHAGGSTVVKLAVGDTLKIKVVGGQINFDLNDSWSVAYIG